MQGGKKLEKYFKAISDSVMYAREKVRGWVNSSYKDSVQADNVLAAMSDVRVNANAVTKEMERMIKANEDVGKSGMGALMEELRSVIDPEGQTLTEGTMKRWGHSNVADGSVYSSITSNYQLLMDAVEMRLSQTSLRVVEKTIEPPGKSAMMRGQGKDSKGVDFQYLVRATWDKDKTDIEIRTGKEGGKKGLETYEKTISVKASESTYAKASSVADFIEIQYNKDVK